MFLAVLGGMCPCDGATNSKCEDNVCKCDDGYIKENSVCISKSVTKIKIVILSEWVSL